MPILQRQAHAISCEQKKCKTTNCDQTEQFFQLIERAEKWLRETWEHLFTLSKWETQQWGEYRRLKKITGRNVYILMAEYPNIQRIMSLRLNFIPVGNKIYL